MLILENRGSHIRESFALLNDFYSGCHHLLHKQFLLFDMSFENDLNSVYKSDIQKHIDYRFKMRIVDKYVMVESARGEVAFLCCF